MTQAVHIQLTNKRGMKMSIPRGQVATAVLSDIAQATPLPEGHDDDTLLFYECETLIECENGSCWPVKESRAVIISLLDSVQILVESEDNHGQG